MHFEKVKFLLKDGSSASVCVNEAHVRCYAYDQSECGVIGFRELYIYATDNAKVGGSGLSKRNNFNINVMGLAQLATSAYPSFYKIMKEENVRLQHDIDSIEDPGYGECHLALGPNATWPRRLKCSCGEI